MHAVRSKRQANSHMKVRVVLGSEVHPFWNRCYGAPKERRNQSSAGSRNAALCGAAVAAAVQRWLARKDRTVLAQ